MGLRQLGKVLGERLEGLGGVVDLALIGLDNALEKARLGIARVGGERRIDLVHRRDVLAVADHPGCLGQVRGEAAGRRGDLRTAGRERRRLLGGGRAAKQHEKCEQAGGETHRCSQLRRTAQRQSILAEASIGDALRIFRGMPRCDCSCAI